MSRIDPELMADLIRDAELMENGMISCGDEFRRPVDRTEQERILWGLSKAFYDVILYILKTVGHGTDRSPKTRILRELCIAFRDVISFILKRNGEKGGSA
jgi:hypothetical protein